MKLISQFTTGAIGILFLLAPQSFAQSSCTTTIAGNIPTPSTAPGVVAKVVTADLRFPRGIIFDSAGHLLVVDRGVGVKALTLQDDGGACVYATDTKIVINDTTLNHGIELSQDGKTLFVSNVDKVFSYAYNPNSAATTGTGQVIIGGMFNTDHSTRTILRSRKDPGVLVVNRGSQSNIDPLASNISTGHGQVKAFNLMQLGKNPFDFTQDGSIMGWGIRNDVGIAEHPIKGGIWTVENSVDDISRNGTDFHQQNPGEKLNYMGTLLQNTSPNKGSNFGYPECFAAWAPKAVPNPPAGLQVGQQFSINDNVSDNQCQQRTAPRLVFDAHMAPLDIKFGSLGRKAFVTFHGSHDRNVPKGYKVSRIDFNKNGQPVAPSTSKKALHDIVKQANTKGCPGKPCLRPAGLAFDKTNRLFFTSDASGEIYVATGI